MGYHFLQWYIHGQGTLVPLNTSPPTLKYFLLISVVHTQTADRKVGGGMKEGSGDEHD